MQKQTIVATSTTEAEYVAAASCCGQVLWIQNQMLDYGFNFMNTKIYIDNESTICIVKNPVYHSKTKHIAIRHHFIRDAYEKKLIQVLKIHTDDNVADLLTKAFDVSSTMAVLDSCPKHNMVAYLEKSEGNAEFHEIIDFLKRTSSFNHALTVPIEHQPDPSPRPSPTTTIPDSIPKTFGENLGGHSSSDKSLSGNESDMTLQSVYDLCLSLYAQVSDQAKERQDLQNEGTEEKNEGTEEKNEGTEEHIEGTEENLSTEEHIERSEAIRNRPPTKNQLRNQMMTYLKHVGNFKHAELKIKKFEEVQALYEKIKRSDEDFISIGSAKDERLIKKINEKGVDYNLKVKSLKENVKEEVQEGNAMKRKWRKKEVVMKYLTEILPINEWMQSVYEVLNAVVSLVTGQIQDEILKSFDRLDWTIVSWKLHSSSRVHTLVTETGLIIHMLVEKKYPLRKEVLMQMLKLKLESEEDSTMALELIRFIKKYLRVRT
ncbi:hypothetical protein Tco_0140608 [Tanacetum coccineum]